MESLQELFRIGRGPSSSHTMGPATAALRFLERVQQAQALRVTLYGSLGATGKGHRTDLALTAALGDLPLELMWKPEESLPEHPNGMLLEALDAAKQVIASQKAYSVGGGAVHFEGEADAPACVYDLGNMTDILRYCTQTGKTFWEYVEEREGSDIWAFLAQVNAVMHAAIERGLRAEGVLPGGLGLARKAWTFYRKIKLTGGKARDEGFLPAYALAVAEENAMGNEIVTAPTCGSSGVLPAVIRHLEDIAPTSEEHVLRALATAGLIGNLIKHNASISGAEVGCQGEVGAACAMAAAAAAQLMGGSIRQIEYAAEMGLEHHLGLTCDPVNGLVQIPCIERNSFAAMRAVDCATFALYSDGSHRVSFDEVVHAMKETGRNLPTIYRETSEGGLAIVYRYPPASTKP